MTGKTSSPSEVIRIHLESIQHLVTQLRALQTTTAIMAPAWEPKLPRMISDLDEYISAIEDRPDIFISAMMAKATGTAPHIAPHIRSAAG